MMYDALRQAISDVAFTTPTPFTGDGSAVDHEALAANLQFLRDAGARVIIPNGNTGEYYALTHAERVAIVETAVDAVGDDLTVIAGAGGSAATVRQLATAYEAAGVDALMVMYPGHTYIHEQGIYEYYAEICAATDLGVVLYKRGPRLSDQNIARLAAHENVVAVKFAENDIDAFARTRALTDAPVTWSVGLAERFVPAFVAEGATGFTTGIGNFLPGRVLALMEAVEANDLARMRRIRDELRPLEELRAEAGPGSSFPNGNNVPLVKHGLAQIGQHGGPVRPPLVELTAADRERVDALLGAAGAETG